VFSTVKPDHGRVVAHPDITRSSNLNFGPSCLKNGFLETSAGIQASPGELSVNETLRAVGITKEIDHPLGTASNVQVGFTCAHFR
jgi:hypothetical protein